MTRKKWTESISDLRDNLSWFYLCVIGILEAMDREWGQEKIFGEIMVEKFSNLVKTVSPQIQVAQWTLSRRNKLRHIIINLLKSSDKEKSIESKENNYQLELSS